MPVFRYAKVLLQTPGIGSVLLCFLGLVLGAGLLSEWGISRSGTHHKPVQTTARSIAAPTALTPKDLKVADHHPAIELATSHQLPAQEISATSKKSVKLSKPSLVRSVFHEPIANDQLGFLSDYAGRPANDVVREQRLRKFMSQVVPYAPFHFGTDMPLPNVIQSVLSASPLPVEIREGRYMMLSTQSERGAARGFLWIDLQKGIALGGIFFHPSNGEPTPTLTLFSKQVNENSLEMSQLPSAFAQDLSQWAALAGLPPVTTRYFINASNKKIVLAHDEDLCKNTDGRSVPSAEACKEMHEYAADVDMKAADFLHRTDYASNATMRLISR